MFKDRQQNLIFGIGKKKEGKEIEFSEQIFTITDRYYKEVAINERDFLAAD